MRASVPILTLAVALLLASTPAVAHELLAPDTVQADGAGHFAVEVTIVITSPAEFGSMDEWDLGNTDVGVHADGFCMVTIEPGESTWTIYGNLIDPGLQGEIAYEHSMCDGWTGYVTTVILPPTVPARTDTWSAVKSLYR